MSRGDVIEAAIFSYGGVRLDAVHRSEASPASVPTLELDPWGAWFLSVDDTCGAVGQ